MEKWENRQIADELRRGLGLPADRDVFGHSLPPVRIENDANLIGLRELRRGALRPIRIRRQQSVYGIVIRWGSGLGAAFVLDNELYRGPHRLSGEIGHIRIHSVGGADALRDIREVEYKKCPRCDEYCLETLIRVPALLSHLRAQGEDYGNIRAAIDHAREDEGKARSAFAMAAQALVTRWARSYRHSTWSGS